MKTSATELHECPVCGYGEMAEAPAEGAICPSCGTQFESEGYDLSPRELRSNWIDRYMPWFSRGILPPRNWSPYRQLIVAGFGSDLVRHSRMKTDADYRYAVDEAFSDVRIAKQLKVLRETRDVPLTQRGLAERAEMKQSRISELEGMNYSSWSVSTLKRLARALGVRFRYSFAGWGELVPEIETGLSPKALAIPSFEHEPAFSGEATHPAAVQSWDYVYNFRTGPSWMLSVPTQQISGSQQEQAVSQTSEQEESIREKQVTRAAELSRYPKQAAQLV